MNRSDISGSERAHYSKVYGINRVSILGELPYFDITENLPQDLMHILLEGVFPLHLEQLVNYVVFESAVLSISQINSRIRSSYFQEKPCPLNETGIQGSGSQTGEF